MALWVWRFVEGDPPHFFHAPRIYPLNLYYIYNGCVGVKKGKKRGICSVVLKNVLTLHPKMIVYNHPNDCI